jgi:hypothetical protein
VIGTQIPWNRDLASHGLLKHAAQRLTIHNAGMDSKTDDSAGVVIHHRKYPVRSQRHRVATK